MNKLIEELAEHCTIQYRDGHGEYVDQVDVEKFAKLIVKECVTVLNNRFMGDMNREDMEVRRCVVDIKEHFGVE